MDRRSFLKMLGLAAPVVAAPKYFLPPIGGWHSEAIVNPFTPGEVMFFLDSEGWRKRERFDTQMLRLGLNLYSPLVIAGWKG